MTGGGPCPPSRKVLVVGNSVSTTVVPGRRSRHDGPYPAVLERLLRQAGHAVSVRNSSRPFDQLHQGVRRFMDHERMQFPDVLVVQYGAVECRPAVVPNSVLEHLHTWDKGVGPAARAYRRVVVPAIWRAVRGYQRVLCAGLGLRTWRMAPERFGHELKRLVEFARQDHMLVLVLDGNPPGERVLAFIPGLDRRWALYQDLLSRTVAEIGDPDVRLVPMSSVADELGMDAALPDGIHLSGAGHRQVAEMLAAHIAPWLQRTASAV